MGVLQTFPLRLKSLAQPDAFNAFAALLARRLLFKNSFALSFNCSDTVKAKAVCHLPVAVV